MARRIAGSTDEDLWLVAGDIPFAYLVTDDDSPSAAFESYAQIMMNWVDAVRKGEGLDDVFPMGHPATEANADELESRIEFLRRDLPGYIRY